MEAADSFFDLSANPEHFLINGTARRSIARRSTVRRLRPKIIA